MAYSHDTGRNKGVVMPDTLLAYARKQADIVTLREMFGRTILSLKQAGWQNAISHRKLYSNSSKIGYFNLCGNSAGSEANSRAFNNTGTVITAAVLLLFVLAGHSATRTILICMHCLRIFLHMSSYQAIIYPCLHWQSCHCDGNGHDNS